MRLLKNGFLKSTTLATSDDSLLPMAAENTNWFCGLNANENTLSTCFMAGDSRVNSNPFAIIIHTIMMRNHNRIAKDLKLRHPSLSDEQLFQKAKSINVDIYQRIIFDEWMPIVLGTATSNEILGNLGTKSKSFNNEADHLIFNEYAVAASRFYLSMMPNELRNYAIDSATESSRRYV